jgi:hypothetical protein
MDNNQIITDEVITEEPHPNFIEGNTSAITLEDLKTKCIIPSFGMTNELTLSHQEIAESIIKAAAERYGKANLTEMEYRVSHPIAGRIPSAIHRKATELLEHEKTLFYQRIAACLTVESKSRTICGENTDLTIGFVRSYHTTNLYGSKVPEKITFYIGTKVRVCSNMCLTVNGLRDNIECLTAADVYQNASELIDSYQANSEQDIESLEGLGQTRINTSQFSMLIGRLRLYQALSTQEQHKLPEILLGDALCNEATRLFVSSKWGLKDGQDSINCFELLQCFNEACKQSYIHNFLPKNANCTELCLNVQRVLEGDNENPYSWFLN